MNQEKNKSVGLLDDYLPQKEAAEAIGRSETSMWRYRGSKLPYYRIAGQIYYKRDDLQLFIESARVEPAK